MKKGLFILLTSCLLATTSFATLWRVNNISGVNANFTDLPAAYTAASAGDTIYVEPSPNQYSTITLTKKLIIIGNGYFTNVTSFSTMNTGLQANATSSTLTHIYFNPGSEFSTIMGCNVIGQLIVAASNVTVKRNRIGSQGYPMYVSNYHPTLGTYSALTNMDIRQNVIDYGIVSTQFSTSGGGAITNMNIQNNILLSNITFPVGISGFMQNNYFAGGTNSFYNFQFNNNIQMAGAFTANNNVYFNNIGNSTQFGTANGNQQNVSTTALFTNFGNTTENRYILNPTGPGIAAGFGGVDVGIFGGPDPYKYSGIPPVPSIYLLSAPATTTTSTLPVTISTRSNN
jgi:hypothetical protein